MFKSYFLFEFFFFGTKQQQKCSKNNPSRTPEALRAQRLELSKLLTPVSFISLFSLSLTLSLLFSHTVLVPLRYTKLMPV